MCGFVLGVGAEGIQDGIVAEGVVVSRAVEMLVLVSYVGRIGGVEASTAVGVLVCGVGGATAEGMEMVGGCADAGTVHGIVASVTSDVDAGLDSPLQHKLREVWRACDIFDPCSTMVFRGDISGTGTRPSSLEKLDRGPELPGCIHLGNDSRVVCRRRRIARCLDMRW